MGKETVTVDRHLWLGGSDMKRLLSASNELAYEKAFPDSVAQFSNKYTEYGDKCEPLVRNLLMKTAFQEYEFFEDVRYDNELAIRANVDGYADSSEPPLGLEIKTSTMKKNFDDCVEMYASQMLLYSYMYDKVDWILAVHFHDGTCTEDVRLESIQYDIFTFDELLEICGISDENDFVDKIYTFWEKVAEIESSGRTSRNEALDTLLLDYADCKKELEEIRKEIEHQYNEMGLDNLSYKSDFGSISYTENSTRKTFDKSAFEQDFPELYDDYVSETSIAGGLRINIKEEN